MSGPAEATTVHTSILRCMLATEDAYAYWRRVDLAVPVSERAKLAFDQRWFGTKSEARVEVLVRTLAERFDPYPEALACLQRLGTVPSSLRPLLPLADE